MTRISPAPTSAAPASSLRPRPRPPFLSWPVSCREFYRALWLAMVLPLAWGIILFGVRPLSMLISALLAATFTHVLLKRVLRWKNGRLLVYQHSIVSAIVLVSLAHPLWPTWTVTCAALVLPLILAVLGGPGRERVHIAIVAALAIQFGIMPWLPGMHAYAGGAGGRDHDDAILAKDRLLMGDIRNQRPFSVRLWPTSLDLAGNDAVQLTPPAVTAINAFDELGRTLPGDATGQAPRTAAEPLSAEQKSAARNLLDNAFAFDLPGMDMLLLGAVPGRVGTVSLIGIVVGGLFLSYRHILRSRSTFLFLTIFILASAMIAFPPTIILRAGLPTFVAVVSTFPAELFSLLAYLVLNSDAPFAAVFILALPGTEPLTPRGRRIFVIAAALLAAILHRISPATPAASLALVALMPAAPLFDYLFSRRSWLTSSRAA